MNKTLKNDAKARQNLLELKANVKETVQRVLKTRTECLKTMVEVQKFGTDHYKTSSKGVKNSKVYQRNFYRDFSDSDNIRNSQISKYN